MYKWFVWGEGVGRVDSERDEFEGERELSGVRTDRKNGAVEFIIDEWRRKFQLGKEVTSPIATANWNVWLERLIDVGA